MPQVLVPVRPNDPPFFAFLAERTMDGLDPPGVRNEHWERWNDAWRSNPLETMWEQLHRKGADGNIVSRIVLECERRTPNEIDRMAVTNGMAWPAIDAKHREVIIECVEERRKEDLAADRKRLAVQFYTGVIGNGFIGSTSNRTSDGILNLDNDADRDKFLYAWGPWIESGILSGLGHDAGLIRGRRDATLALMRNLEKWIKGWNSFTEPLPWVDHAGGVVTEWADVPDDIEAWTFARYMFQRDPLGTHTVDRVGKRPLWIASSGHWTNAQLGPPASPKRRGILTVAEAMDFRSRGFGVTSAYQQHDGIVNLPQQDRTVNLNA